jgi:hypothetical protein
MQIIKQSLEELHPLLDNRDNNSTPVMGHTHFLTREKNDISKSGLRTRD